MKTALFRILYQPLLDRISFLFCTIYITKYVVLLLFGRQNDVAQSKPYYTVGDK